MSLYLLPTDFFGAPAARPASRCSVQQHQRRRSDSMDIDDLATLLFGGSAQRDPFDAVLSHLQPSGFARAQAAQVQARRQHERELQHRRALALQQAQQQREREREAARRREYEATQAAAYFAALMEQRQLEEQQRAEAKRAHARRVKAQQAAYEAEIRQLLEHRLRQQRQAQLELRQKQEQELRRKQAQAQQQHAQREDVTLEEAIQDIFGGFAQFFGGAFEQPRQAQQQERKADKGKAKETNNNNGQHLASVPEQNEPIDVDMVDAPSPAPAAAAAPEIATAPAAAAADAKPAAAAATEHLLFTHAVPAPKDFDLSTLGLTVDTATHQVRISGLWPSPSASATRSASPTPSASSSQRGRGRSPRRSRVADVDENGEEILPPSADDDEEDFVDLGAPSSASTGTVKEEAHKSESITLDLPRDADVDSLRADLTDNGLDIYVKRIGHDLELD